MMRDIMRPARWTVRSDDTLRRAERILARRRVHYVLVVDGGKLVGLLTERDVLDQHTSTSDPWWRVSVGRAMQTVPATASPDEPVSNARARLRGSPADVLPVVEHGFLLGEISATDILETELRRAEPAPLPITVGDAMTEAVATVAPSDTLLAAATLMVDHQLRHLPVIQDGAVAGMISDRDIRNVAGDPAGFVALHEAGSADVMNVRDAMTPAATTIRGDRPLRDAARILADGHIGALPVVDREGKLIGVVSYVDVLRALTV